MSNFRGWEWIIILLLALLLFGGFKKLPDAARGLGRSLRIFKAETKGLVEDDDAPQANTTTTAAQTQAAVVQPVTQVQPAQVAPAQPIAAAPPQPVVVTEPAADAQAGSNQSA